MQAKVSEEPESMLWSELEDRQLRAPERQLLDAIANGQLDQHLVAIADAVHARRELLHTVRSAGAIAQFCVGETVANRFAAPTWIVARRIAEDGYFADAAHLVDI